MKVFRSDEHLQDLIDPVLNLLIDPEPLIEHLFDRTEGERGQHVAIGARVARVARVEVLGHPFDVVDADFGWQMLVQF